MIQLSFLLESSFIALTAIVVGTVFGLIVSHTVIRDVASQPAYSMVTLHVPWVNLTIVFTVVYLVALATSLAPAIRRVADLPGRGAALRVVAHVDAGADDRAALADARSAGGTSAADGREDDRGVERLGGSS